MSYRYLLLIAVAMIGILGVSACGSDSEDVPSLRTGAEAREIDPTVSAEDKVLDNEAKMMAFTQCLRDQGIEVLDPIVDADGNVGKPELAEGVAPNKKQWGPVWESCAEHLEGLTREKERVDLSEQVDQWMAVAACLRDKGYDLDEPTAETLEQWMGEFKDTLNWDNPQEAADYEECSRDAGMGAGGK